MKNTHFFFLFDSQKSPRKSVKDYVSNVDDFVAPIENFVDFDNFLNYSATNLKSKWPQKVKLSISQ